MSQKNKIEQAETPTETPAPDASNRDVKDSALFQKVTAELLELKQRDAERLEADKSARAKAEQDRLESEGKYKEALELREKEFENLKAQHQKDVLQRDLKTELIRKGFNNEIFMNGAMAAFSGDADSVADYVSELAASDSNKMFLSSAPQRNILPAANGVNASDSVVDGSKLFELAKSKDSETKAKAQKALQDYYKTNGRFPEK